jgi:ABC-type thiamine transport system substrate-binding protein
MRTTTLFKTIKNSQKIRVIMNGVGIYTTVKDMRNTFATTNHGLAAESVLFCLSEDRRKAIRENQRHLPTGLLKRINFADIDFDVQVDIV